MNDSMKNPMSAVFRHLAISILYMFIGFMFGQMFLPESFVYMANQIICFVMLALLLMSLCSKKRIIPDRFNMGFVYLFTFIDGILMYPLLTYYLEDLGTSMFITIFISAIVMFSTLAAISNSKEAGYYLGLGKILSVGLIGVIIALVINLFIGGDMMNLVISCVSLIVFLGYILFDVSLLKARIECGQIQDKHDLSIHVLNLYLDFINILLDLLNIVSKLKD